jgi:outer membrane protein TolC
MKNRFQKKNELSCRRMSASSLFEFLDPGFRRGDDKRMNNVFSISSFSRKRESMYGKGLDSGLRRNDDKVLSAGFRWGDDKRMNNVFSISSFSRKRESMHGKGLDSGLRRNDVKVLSAGFRWADDKFRFVFALMSVFLFMGFNAHAQTMTYEQVLQQVVDNYPSLQTTAIAVERARLESVRVESQLGWQLNAAAGVQHDMSSTFGSAQDTLNLNGNISRLLESGNTLGFVANINRLDADTSFPGSPNPALSTNVGVNYRMPLQKGADNTSLVQGRLQAEVAVAQANADRRNVYDQIAAQVIDLYINAATINARIENTQLAIQRSQRLLKYNQDRAGLGIAEDKDLLQVRAQLRSREAELSALEMQWQAQRINLNRLMGRDVDADLQLQRNADTRISQSKDDMLQQATQHSPAMAVIDVRMKQADTQLELSRDKRKDKLDVVFNAGYKTLSGDSTPSDVSEGEMVGGVQLEFGRGLDLSGYDAELQQAQLSRSAALQDQKQVLLDLRYNIAGVLAEINAGNVALTAYEKSVASEQAKLKEAEQRYKRGRTDTDQLVQFEAQLATAELNYDLQGIELARRAHKLRLLLGDVWKTVKVE